MNTLTEPAAIIRGWDAISRTVGRSRVQLWRDIGQGLFPAPLQLGPNSVGWRRDEIEQWLASRPRRHYGAPDTGKAA